ncbi:MAG: c-type cytochrome [Burkholderiales bacterium]|nr:c-type cytochrome [Burkholderiales bacterium]
MAIAVFTGLSSAYAAGDVERGKLLYETRCGACHNSSVHGRSARKAASFASLRAQVQRWSRESGGVWNAGDIDDITLYLNQRFYHFPCPQGLCKGNKAPLTG